MWMLWRLCLVVCILAANGCQSGTSSKPAPHETSFSDLWKTYRHCQKSEDPLEMKADALHLDETVQILADEKDATLVPDGLERLILDQPSRLAVDPKAMAASCALLAGYQARVAGQPRLAAEMFGHILSNYSASRYRYYVLQAYHALKNITGGEQFLPQHLLPSIDPGL
jgi:hypothetical protein